MNEWDIFGPPKQKTKNTAQFLNEETIFGCSVQGQSKKVESEDHM